MFAHHAHGKASLWMSLNCQPHHMGRVAEGAPTCTTLQSPRRCSIYHCIKLGVEWADVFLIAMLSDSSELYDKQQTWITCPLVLSRITQPCTLGFNAFQNCVCKAIYIYMIYVVQLLRFLPTPACRSLPRCAFMHPRS